MRIQIKVAIRECSVCGEKQAMELALDAGHFFTVSDARCPKCAEKYGFGAIDVPDPDTRPSYKTIKKSVVRQENDLAELIGGHRQKASGATRWQKGDARNTFKYLGEAKQTSKNSFVLKRDMLDKLRSECALEEVPVVSITFIDSGGTHEDCWVLLPRDKIERIV